MNSGRRVSPLGFGTPSQALKLSFRPGRGQRAL